MPLRALACMHLHCTHQTGLVLTYVSMDTMAISSNWQAQTSGDSCYLQYLVQDNFIGRRVCGFKFALCDSLSNGMHGLGCFVPCAP